MSVVHVENTLGAAFLGHSAEAALFGLTSLQCGLYYWRTREDGWRLKSLIGVLWLLDTVHLALTTHAMWFYLIKNYNNPDSLAMPVWSLCAQCSITAATEFLIRVVFARRVWTLSQRNVVFVAILGILSLFSFAMAVAYVVEACDVGSFDKIAALSWIIVASLAAGMVTDLFIAGSLVFLLWKMRSGFGHSLVNVIILYSVNTGIVTTVCAILVIVTYITMPANFVWLAFYFVLGKLNLNCLLAGLNTRDALRGRGGGVKAISLSKLSTTAGTASSRTMGCALSPTGKDGGMEITVQTETERKTDSARYVWDEEGIPV